MKMLTLATMTFAALSATASAGTAAGPIGDEWTALMSSHGFDYYVRITDLQRDQRPEKKLIWVLAVQDGRKSYMSRYNINCTDQTIKDEYRSLFFDDGTVDGHAMNHLERRPATPGTLGGMLADLACS
jgi:hypothetical protein